MGLGELVPEGHLTITSRTQTLLQSTILITPTTIRIAGKTGVTGETAWAPGQVSTATRDTGTTTILTITTAAAVAEKAATTEKENGTETVITPIVLTPDTIQTRTGHPLTACLLHLHLTLPTPKNLPQPLLRDWTFPHGQGARA